MLLVKTDILPTRLTNERLTTFPAQPAKPFASRLTTYCDEPDEMGLRVNRKGDEDAKSFRKNLDWPHYFCTGGHHFQALRNSSGNPAVLWLAPAPRAHLTRYHGFGTTAPF